MKKIKSNQIKKEENDILKLYYISFKNSKTNKTVYYNN